MVALALRCGIELRVEELGEHDDDVSGMLVHDGANAVIGVNSRHHVNRQRFTIAHELGHYFLHPDERVHVDGRRVRIEFRDKRSSMAVDRKEIEANTFAAALLMPADWVHADVEKYDGLDESAIEELARRYQVSVHAMTLRLNNLGLLDPDGIAP